MYKMSSRAATQLYEIILLLPDDSKSKIPLSIMNLLEIKKIDTEEINIKSVEHINDTALLDETKKYLSYIFLRYLANDEEKEELNRILSENDLRYQMLLRTKYDISNIFDVEEKRKENVETEKIQIEEINIEKNNKLIKAEEQKWWRKILEKIKSIIKR